MNRPNEYAEYDRFKHRAILQSILRNLVWNGSCSKCNKRFMPNTDTVESIPIEDLGNLLMEADSGKLNPRNETINLEYVELESNNKLSYADFDIVDENNHPIIKPLKIWNQNPKEIKILLKCKHVDESGKTCGHENLYPFTKEVTGVEPENFFDSIKLDY